MFRNKNIVDFTLAKYTSGMNADILVDRVHKYYWCKVPKNELKNTAIQMAFQKTFTLYTWLQLFMMIAL